MKSQLRIRVTADTAGVWRRACTEARERETGGMLFGEHVAESEFLVVEATVHPGGFVASFVRVLKDGLARLESFFRRTRYEFTRFNYLGEWHSHPSFALRPSSTDDKTMQALVEEPSTRAFFAVLMIVQLENDHLRAGAWAYFPASHRRTCIVTLDEPPETC